MSPLPIELSWEPRILEGIRIALRLMAGSVATPKVGAKNAKPTKPKSKQAKQATVDERMAALIQEDPSRVDWSAAKWAEKVKKSKTAVQLTTTWKKTIRGARALKESKRGERWRR